MSVVKLILCSSKCDTSLGKSPRVVHYPGLLLCVLCVCLEPATVGYMFVVLMHAFCDMLAYQTTRLRYVFAVLTLCSPVHDDLH